MRTLGIAAMRSCFRPKLAVLIALPLITCARPIRVESPTKPIFREVRLPGRVVILGGPFGDKASYGTLVADTLLRLHEAAFAGAEDIYVHLGPGDTVRGMTYEYGRERDFEKRVADYYPLLGLPIERERVPLPTTSPTLLDQLPLERVVWQDNLTRFELHLDTVPGARRSRAVWLDRRPKGPTRM
jgi:hypothetical protein